MQLQWTCTKDRWIWYCCYPSSRRWRLSPLRWRCLRCWASPLQGSWMASQMLQMQGLHEDPWFYHRMRRSRQRCLLQNMLRQEVGTSRLWFCLRIWFLANGWHVWGWIEKCSSLCSTKHNINSRTWRSRLSTLRWRCLCRWTTTRQRNCLA